MKLPPAPLFCPRCKGQIFFGTEVCILHYPDPDFRAFAAGMYIGNPLTHIYIGCVRWSCNRGELSIGKWTARTDRTGFVMLPNGSQMDFSPKNDSEPAVCEVDGA